MVTFTKEEIKWIAFSLRMTREQYLHAAEKEDSDFVKSIYQIRIEQYEDIILRLNQCIDQNDKRIEIK